MVDVDESENEMEDPADDAFFLAVASAAAWIRKWNAELPELVADADLVNKSAYANLVFTKSDLKTLNHRLAERYVVLADVTSVNGWQGVIQEALIELLLQKDQPDDVKIAIADRVAEHRGLDPHELEDSIGIGYLYFWLCRLRQAVGFRVNLKDEIGRRFGHDPTTVRRLIQAFKKTVGLDADE